MRLGAEAILGITQIGKRCHNRCSIFHQTGDCIMPRGGLFARVLAGGAVAVGDPVEIEATVPRSALQAVVLTLSDRCAAGVTQDTAGPAVAALLRESMPAHIYASRSCPTSAARWPSACATMPTATASTWSSRWAALGSPRATSPRRPCVT